MIKVRPMNITIPELSLVVLIGASGSGKSTFARQHFKPTEMLSSDFCRGLVSRRRERPGGDQRRLRRAALHRRQAAGGREAGRGGRHQRAAGSAQAAGRAGARIPLPAGRHRAGHAGAGLPGAQRGARPDRDFGPHVVRNQIRSLRQSLRGLEREGFRHVFVLHSPEQVEAATVTREPLYNNKKHEHGPFDIIGDIHGCFDELTALLTELGYQRQTGHDVTPPEGRKAVFLGDLVDRGPKTPDVLRLVMGMVAAGTALCVPGNHDIKLLRKLRGKDVQITHGLAETLAQLEAEPPEFIGAGQDVSGRPGQPLRAGRRQAGGGPRGHEGGDAGARVGQGARVRAVRRDDGETDEFGLPVRYNWAAEYRGAATVVYGHTPVPAPEWLNHTINIDTGCVFGGQADGPALAGAGAGLRPGARDLRRAGASVPACRTSRPLPSRPSSSTTTCWTSTTCSASG